MGWEDYINNMLAKEAVQCGIYSKQGAVYAQSSNLNVTAEEVLGLMQAIESGNPNIKINGIPCTKICAIKEDGYVQAKTKQPVVGDSKMFYHAETANTVIVVVGMHGPRERNSSVLCHEYADYLAKASY